MATDVNNTIDGEVIESAKSLPPDMVLMRLENEHIMSVAMSKPRDYVKMRQSLLSELEAFPESAAKAIYNKPVGRENDKCRDCGAEVFRKKGRMADRCFKCKSQNLEEGGMKYARGLSIRAAESIRVAFGFNRIQTSVTPLDEDHVKVQSTFVDYVTGNVSIDDQIVAKYYTNRDKQKVRYDDDRFYNLVVKAEKSKVRRQVILDSVPAAMKAAYHDKCEKLIDDLLDDATEDRIVSNFAAKGLKLEHIESLLGRPRSMGWRKDDRKTLLGVWNSLDSGETTAAELIGQLTGSDDNGGRKPVGRSSLNESVGAAKPEPTEPRGFTRQQIEAAQAEVLELLASQPMGLSTDALAGASGADNRLVFEATNQLHGDGRIALLPDGGGWTLPDASESQATDEPLKSPGASETPQETIDDPIALAPRGYKGRLRKATTIEDVDAIVAESAHDGSNSDADHKLLVAAANHRAGQLEGKT